MDVLMIAVLAAIAIIAVTAWAPKLGTSAPLVLVLLGVGISLLPFSEPFVVEPEWILAGVLPPLLYATSMSMPTMDFRRDFAAISGLSVVLVVISAVVLGFLFTLLIPGISLAVGIALGAIISPTDAVATSIVRRLGVSPRLVTVLEGESLLNDASALVLLRSAIAAASATAGSVSLWSVAGDFVFAVVAAVAIGVAVGALSLVIRRRVTDTSIATGISVLVPFVAYFPAEHIHASGLVATVSAGLVAGAGSAKFLDPEIRIAEASNWKTLELFVEGAVFLIMGLELFGFIKEVEESERGVLTALGLAVLAAVVVVVLRAGYLAPLLWGLARRRRRMDESRQFLTDMRQRLDDGTFEDVARRHEGTDASKEVPARFRDPGRKGFRPGHRVRRKIAESTSAQGRVPNRTEMFSTRITRRLADIDYLAAEPLGPKEGTVLVWAGMRGVVTVAAAQTLPAGTPQRATLVLVAFFVAAGTLLVQGGTLPWLVRTLGVARPKTIDPEERTRLLAILHEAGERVIDDPDLRRPDGTDYDERILAQVRRVMSSEDRELDEQEDPEGGRARRAAQARELRLRVLEAQRGALLEARSLGTFSSAALKSALTVLDADQISTELRQHGDD